MVGGARPTTDYPLSGIGIPSLQVTDVETISMMLLGRHGGRPLQMGATSKVVEHRCIFNTCGMCYNLFIRYVF